MDIYADDTTVSSSASSNEIPKLQEALLEDLQKVEKWSRTNNMYLNPSKTKAMLAVGKRLRKRFDGETSSLQLCLNDEEIEIVRSHKLLGSKIDQDLTYDEYIDELCKKLSKRIGLLRHICPYLKQKQRLVYYQAVLKPAMLTFSQSGHRVVINLLKEFSEYRSVLHVLF